MKNWVWVRIIVISFLMGLFPQKSGLAYWEWTPKTGRWINPRYAVKATPKEQYEWADSFRNDPKNKDLKKAVREFRKLVKRYPNSDDAPKTLAVLGEIYEEMGEYYKAYQSYQKILDQYSSYTHVDSLIEREYAIGNLFFEGQKRKLLGFEILPSGEQAIEIFKKIGENAPYGPYGEVSQYKMGLCYRKIGKLNEAKSAFEDLIKQYPDGEYVDLARFENALATVKQSKKSHYDQQATDQAIEEFQAFIQAHPESESVTEAKETIRELEERKAKKSFEIAKFYESRGERQSAKVYYNEVIEKFPESSFATSAKERLEELGKGS